MSACGDKYAILVIQLSWFVARNVGLLNFENVFYISNKAPQVRRKLLKTQWQLIVQQSKFRDPLQCVRGTRED